MDKFPQYKVFGQDVYKRQGRIMAKYKIELIVESDNDYFDGNQIEDLKNDIEIRLPQSHWL